MTDFGSAAALPRIAPLDPSKHVKYTLGMVLGIDDFDQEFAYLAGRDRWLARDLTGYGTIWGLRVEVELELEATGPRINVAPGVAITPCGQLVCVSPAQCAYLNDWLAANEEEARALLASPPASSLPLYLVLCYRECATDDVPIPGEPCRTEDTLTAPSRLKDDFRLELRTAPPFQPEEDAIRDLVQWLREVPIVAGPGSSVDELVEALREAAESAVAGLASPPSSPPGSPPAGPFDFVLGPPPADLEIPAVGVGEYLRAAFRIWATELRPALRHALPGCETGCSGTCGCGCDGSTACAGEPCGEDVLLLAAIDLPVVDTPEGDLVAGNSGWTIDESRRPYVLHTRLLQEWLLGAGITFEAGSPPSLPSGSPIVDVKAHEVTGPPTADWDAATGVLDLGIPAGEGIDEVKVNVLPPGSNPTVVSLVDGVLTLGVSTGAAGSPGTPGAGVTSVTVSGLPSGSAPTATLSNGVLALGIPAGPKGNPGTPGQNGADGIQFVVAAGEFGPLGGTKWNFNNLEATLLSGGPSGLYFLTFDGFEMRKGYVVKGTVMTRVTDRAHTFELVPVDDTLKRLLQEIQNPPDPDKGLFARVVSDDLKTLSRGFVVEVSDYAKVI